MFRGSVLSGRGPVVPLLIRGPTGAELDVNAVVDTGFTAVLTLPVPIVSALDLVLNSKGELVLADGTIRPFDLYSAEVLWDGNWVPVLASALGDDVLIGMRMVAGHRVIIEAVPGGAVEIVRLP